MEEKDNISYSFIYSKITQFKKIKNKKFKNKSFKEVIIKTAIIMY